MPIAAVPSLLNRPSAGRIALRTTATAALLAALVACGGGGSSGDAGTAGSGTGTTAATTSTAPLTDTSTATDVVMPTIRTGVAQGSASITSETMQAHARTAAQSLGWHRLLASGTGRAGLLGATRESPAETVSQACPNGGSMSASATDVNGDGDLFGANEPLTVAFNACVVATGMALQGSIDVAEVAREWSGEVQTASSFAFTLRDYGIASIALVDGSGYGWLQRLTQGLRMVYAFNGVQLKTAQGTALLNIDTDSVLSAGLVTTTMGGSTATSQGTFAVATLQPVTGPIGAAPTAGVIETSDAAGNRLQVVPLADGMHYEARLLPAGATSPSVTQVMSWSEAGF